MSRRRIVLELGETTTETHCRGCMYLDFYDAKKCEVFGLLDPPALRSYSCRSAELRPETVEAIRTALETFVLVSETDDEKPALADFERLFGGVE